jgi:4-hydroxy-2-oxoheptanedioate aldolase
MMKMQPAANLKARIARGELTVGVLAIDHVWPGLVEICLRAGLDYLIVDGEHAGPPAPLLADIFALGRLAGFPVLYRPPVTDAPHVRFALDLGPCGLLLPMVNEAGQLDAVREGALLPPRGWRRPGGAGNRWVSGIQYDNWKAEVEEDLIILPQIESLVGLANVDAIAAHEMTTHLAVGPYDLSAHLGVCWKPESPELQAALRRIKEVAERHGKTLWGIGAPAVTEGLGLHFYALGEPLQFMETKLKELVADLRGG